MPAAPARIERSIDCGLVTRSQAGDEEATSELAAQVRPIAQRYASRFFADPTRAEDLAQTAMMKAFARVRDVRAPEAFQGWLLRITRNECLNELARHRVAQVPISTLEEQGTALEAPAGGEDDPEESLVRVQLQSLVRQVITTLPSHYRRTLTMRALEDRSYEEISEELDVPVAVARLWYCRARKRFRQAFVDAMVARRNVSTACQAMGGDIAEMIEGTLSRADRDRVQGHLAGCHVCRQTEDELRATAFRVPNRAMLLGFGLLGVPRKLAGNTARALRTAHVSARVALGAAGTATVLAGAVGALGGHALASPAPRAGASFVAISGAAGNNAGAPRRGAGHPAASGGTSSGGRAARAAAGSAGLMGSIGGLANTVDGIDPAGTLHLDLALAVPDAGALVLHAVPAALPLLDAVGSQVRSATASQPQGSGQQAHRAAPTAPGAPAGIVPAH